jgi:hypothetical protein
MFRLAPLGRRCALMDYLECRSAFQYCCSNGTVGLVTTQVNTGRLREHRPKLQYKLQYGE